jgi:hypothetical protein
MTFKICKKYSVKHVSPRQKKWRGVFFFLEEGALRAAERRFNPQQQL